MSDNLDSLFRLDGKVIVITGAAGLLGQMHAEAIAAYGGTPILLDLNFNAVQLLADSLNQKYDINCKGYQVDITDETQVKNNANQVKLDFGCINGLINNAANNPKVETDNSENFSRLENFPINIWEQDIAVGLTGAFNCAKYYGVFISENIDGGSIVNISSDLGLIAPDQRLYADPNKPKHLQSVKPVTYSVVKAGLIGLTRYLATYWAEDGVRCNAMCPGGIENGQPSEFIDKVSNLIPLKRMAKANEYQGTLIWMLSDASSYLNGSIVPVEGGRSVW
ncbi:SDR family oxidoreductase [Algibacillus agarilyticus]|uniref:SDR family oxidoreductase n=1 Tax=Algibacillus agarilyticus TaxID=2234133 RepID=UPI0018E52B7F|nr:SDR family oxidoreductase [Algibacillus agarilyticus]